MPKEIGEKVLRGSIRLVQKTSKEVVQANVYVQMNKVVLEGSICSNEVSVKLQKVKGMRRRWES